MGRAMSFETQRERIGLLRASAQALIDDTITEPCWGLAQSLAELAEALVSEWGLPAACFGKGAQVDAELASTEGERLFDCECCAACGEWAGKHENWCIHADHGEPAEPVSSERSPFESDVPEWPEQGDADEAEAAATCESLLDWLDLSGLPAVPPKPPARRLQNWRFDGPEGGEQIPF